MANIIKDSLVKRKKHKGVWRVLTIFKNSVILRRIGNDNPNIVSLQNIVPIIGYSGEVAHYTNLKIKER